MHYCTYCQSHTNDVIIDKPVHKYTLIRKGDEVYREIHCEQCNGFKMGFNTKIGSYSYGEFI